MSWSIYVTGTKAGVQKYVQEIKPSYETDREAFERARAFILDEVSRVASNGVAIEAAGHADRTNKIVVNNAPLQLDE